MDLLKLKPDNAKAIGIILAVIAALVVVYFVFKKVFGLFDSIGEGAHGALQAIGAEDTPEIKAAKEKINGAVTAGSGSYWSPEFYNHAPAGAHILTVDTSHQLCQQIYDAYGVLSFFDTPEDMFAAFKKCPSKAAVSQLVIDFQIMFNADLSAWLSKHSYGDDNKKVLAQAIAYCDTLPAY